MTPTHTQAHTHTCISTQRHKYTYKYEGLKKSSISYMQRSLVAWSSFGLHEISDVTNYNSIARLESDMDLIPH